ncbi:hypothetical protein MASR1M8_09860 [Thermomonas brevis]
MNAAAAKVESGDPVGEFCNSLERDKGLTARLRRARNPDEVSALEAVIRLADRLAATGLRIGPNSDEYVGALAILLAQSRVNRDETSSVGKASLAARLGAKTNDRRRLSDLRFSRLIHANNVEDRLRQLRRALRMLDAPLPARTLAKGWELLNSPAGRHRFARDYFTASDNSAIESENASAIATEQESTP